MAARLGATHVGVIFAQSPRRISPSAAKEVFMAAGDLARVGVFADAAVEEILTAAREAALDIVQLHDLATPSEWKQLRAGFAGEVWQMIPVAAGRGDLLEEWRDAADAADAVVLDTRADGRSGGTGKAFDWRAASSAVREVSARVPVVLAGGLTPSNVGEAVEILAPAVVDVSSGVELAPGIKDPALMRAFAQAVRSASIV